MMRSISVRFTRVRNLVITMIVVAGLSSCSGDVTAPLPSTGVLLKDIVISRLPSPYYHFDYDGQGKVSSVSFASGLTKYDVTYAAGRISQMQNNTAVNHDRLVYVYDDAGRVAAIKETDENDVVFVVLFFTYTGDKLTGLERDRRVTGGYIIDKTLSFSYSADGNLSELTEHLPAIDGVQAEATITDRFEQYDSGINVDGFSLIHDEFFDHLVLLPAVQLQKSNPRRVTRTGDSDNFTVDYTYSYDARNRPLTTSGDLAFTTGPSAGQHFQVGSVFSYYD
ncbi:MAG TPA: hypothetical protein VK542_02730 [Gemmatimonadaceae bacterium]|nr:hypothetical protein [Gemmatimonadaceae bacterium]